MTHRKRWFCLCAASALLLAACTTVMYPGARRPRAEVAIIGASDTSITAIDGRSVGESTPRQKFELLPGPHSISVKINASRQGFMTTTHVFTTGSLTVCFVAKPGREYLTRPSSDDGETWTPSIVDTALAYPVKVFDMAEPGLDCAERIAAEQAGRAARQGAAGTGASPRR